MRWDAQGREEIYEQLALAALSMDSICVQRSLKQNDRKIDQIAVMCGLCEVSSRTFDNSRTELSDLH